MNIEELQEDFRVTFEPVDGLEMTLNGETVTIKAIVSPYDVPKIDFTFGDYKGRLISHQDATNGDEFEERFGYQEITVEIEEVEYES